LWFMKTFLQKRLTISGECMQCPALVLWLAGILFVFGIGDKAVVAAGNDSCRASSKAALKACMASAKSDYELALGKCANVADPAAQKACQDQAKADLKDALQTCKDQYAARQAACTRLGPAPFDPVIIPTNFVATIDNPLYPLTPGTTFINVGKIANV